MIEAFQNINKAFESKVRLGIMAVLMVNEDADFEGKKAFKTHIEALENFLKST